jgi:hypothetical protein
LEHLQKAGFVTKVLDTRDFDAVKKRLGVPDDLAACHTVRGLEIAGLPRDASNSQEADHETHFDRHRAARDG